MDTTTTEEPLTIQVTAERQDFITSIELRTAALDERRNELTPDEACQMLDDIAGGMKRLRDAKAVLEAFLVDWLPTTLTRELRIGTKKWYVGPNKNTKCRSVRATIEALMLVTGGDFDALVDCLSVNCLKPGACRKVLGEAFRAHFDEIVEMDLKTSEPKKSLHELDEKFLK